MDYDDILEELGELRKYQITTYVLVCIPVFLVGANNLSYVFVAGIPKYRCLIPECEDAHMATYDAPWLKWALSDDVELNHCNRFVAKTNFSSGICSEDLFTDQIEACNEWVFDAERTIVNDWKLTCVENQWKLAFVGSSNFAGHLLGSVISGILADRYGRKQILLIASILMGLSGCIHALSPNYETFVVLRFLNSFFCAGIYPVAFIMCVEMAGKRNREMAGMLINIVYALGEAALAVIAWYTKNWVLLQLALSAPALLIFVYYWLVPESVRWLLANKRKREAKNIICEAAKMNNVTLSKSLLKSLKEDASNEDPKFKNHAKLSTIFKQLLKAPTFVTKLLIIFFIWIATSFVYYGLSLTATSLSGNKYVNFCLVSLVEIPSVCVSWVCVGKWGRRWSLVGSLVLCGLTCILTTFISFGKYKIIVSKKSRFLFFVLVTFALLNLFYALWGVSFLYLIGKSGATAAFAVAYIYTSELLPTVIRTGGVSSANTLAQVGAILAPFVPMLSIYGKATPMLLFGGLALLPGILALKLPETLGTKLPETIEEAEKL